MTLPITANDLRALPDEEVSAVMKQLGPAKAEELQHTWEFWARPNQMEPTGNQIGRARVGKECQY